jgi:alpha-glucosidase
MFGVIFLLLIVVAVSANSVTPKPVSDLDSCPGYKASNIKTTSSGLSADLSLAGKACNVYGDDLENLKLTVEYETGKFLHVDRMTKC